MLIRHFIPKHPLILAAFFSALFFIGTGLGGQDSLAIPMAATWSSLALAAVREPLLAAVGQTQTPAYSKTVFRDPIFYLMSLTVMAVAAAWSGIFHVLGRTVRALTHILFMG